MKSKILGLLAVGLLAGPMTANAVILQINGGLLTGATGVNVGGSLFDVSFIDGTCVAVFSGCDASSDFLFSTQASAIAAAQALLDQVFLDTVGGNFDSIPALTRGCSFASNCLAFTPYSFSGVPVVAAQAVNLASGTDNVQIGGAGPSENLTLCSNCVWAVWTQVPEPGTIALLGLGLAGLGLSRRRRAA